ncbi:hypothetical protein BK133_11215 [Paenibacillus sp. FSL H8-0548]|uniref:phage major capsid protein n=1 Tax=Paenibacillus sp. FSL H8-0548 TaxID=1920422 RepID=UPI00096CB374|nr:phage major capsid protein [Paenibacillus sp. FSL H8-0548]OMF35269.1 hypothetical protein BK133_11215 [Paenibacillus sp. FSL H8-0548]
MNRIQEILNRLTEIRSAVDSATEAEITAFETEIRDLNAEKTLLEKRAALKGGIPAATPPAVENPTIEERDKLEVADKYSTIDYRTAFMNFCKTGAPLAAEYRADAFTSTTDSAAVIPTTIVDEIIRKLKTYGQIFDRVRKLNIKGGVNIPISSLSPTATWINETTPSDRLKVPANTSVSFSYYGLECKVAESLLSETVTLASFESTIITLIVEAMTKALDVAILNGSGAGQPLGITLDTRVPAAQIITLTSADFVAWDSWKKKVFGKIPLTYRAGGSFIMAAGTFEGYIDGMVDANGQPIGRVNYGIVDGPQERFGGREVILVEDDVVKPYDTAATGDVVAVYVKLSDYGINSNMQMQMYRWLDHDKNQWVDKAILIADGKLIDPNGVIIVKKGA